jgi:lipid-A-disaccharide synthase
LFPVLIAAARRVAEKIPTAQFVVPRASTIPAGFLESRVAASSGPPITVANGVFPGVLDVSDAGAVASGTATLDAALAGLPFVAVYRMAPVSFLIARALVEVDHIALPNLVAGRRIVPELVQGECTPDAIAAVVETMLDDRDRAQRMRRDLEGIRASLAGDGAFGRAAEAVLEEALRPPV